MLPGNPGPPKRIIKFKANTLIRGRYRTIEELGEGTSGVVYRARDDMMVEDVALKFLRNEPVGEDFECLRREVATGRKVLNPHVCRVNGVDRHHGTTFVSMEYVRGNDMQRELQRFIRLPREMAIRYAIELCSGLDAIHNAQLFLHDPVGIVHRDLKPANVMLDHDGHAKITDLGLAVPAMAAATTAGTPAYMAPEQLMGAPPHPSADIYSLGLMLFEFLTGNRCLINVGTYAQSHAAARARRPSQEVSGLDPSIDHIVEMCLCEEPTRRPTADQLRSLLEDLP